MNNIEEKKNYIIKIIGENYLKDKPDMYITHTYRAVKDYGMSIHEAKQWAWLNTLFGYDIGADHAKAIIDYFEDQSLDILNMLAEDKIELQHITEKELGFHLNYSAFPDKTPDAISYEWLVHL